ncbi:MAG: nucleotidyltransferase domain-containing protein [Candidatus Muirbacterium halophilum]|nr:nucleotidyltransferase domain-containing protein [Candidatus Muirbacterium halophilum]MCK9475223.1 nucleotidyltransferase domain-containing protein [Candidatus Muirbacterium halophilum]
MKKLRLNDFEINCIKESILKYDEKAEIYIFGSRIDLSKKGGDIDVFVKSNVVKIDLLKFKLNILADIEKNLGERKIDLVVKPIDYDENLSIYKHAENTGVKL